jgi:hypothetical protein
MHVTFKNKLKTQNHILKHFYQDITNYCQTEVVQGI